jgi:hypothetical protein
MQSGKEKETTLVYKTLHRKQILRNMNLTPEISSGY